MLGFCLPDYKRHPHAISSSPPKIFAAFKYWNLIQIKSFLVVKNPACMQIPGPGKSTEEGNGNPLQYSCLENSMDRGGDGLQSTGLQKSRT